ncbi:hypothetical protein [Paracoccus sp. ME4]|uniref:hypothetical protein n=1 Tax=Paracoccus sp. ME4 TaxID=3138066 RepID=UPI00398A7A1A
MTEMGRIEDRARAVLAAKDPEQSPVTALLGDDAFCALLMSHRMGQGLRIPAQSDIVPHSARLAYLQALVDGEGIAPARAACNGHRAQLELLKKIRATENPSEDVLSLVPHLERFLADPETSSYWTGLPLLYGENRIAQHVIPLHQPDTPAEAAIGIVMGVLARRPDRSMTISDRDARTEALGFIRIGTDPAHFAFPETASVKSGTNAAIYHYEIDHPGGDFAFFNSLHLDGTHFSALADKVLRNDPLYINEGAQMMARCSYYLQTLGLFHVLAGDTRVTVAGEDGILSAAVDHDWRHKADRMLSALAEKRISPAEHAAMSDYLTKAEVEDDYDWDVIEDMQSRYPDILGHVIRMDRSYIIGGSRAQMEERILAACGGDAALAAADIDAALHDATIIDLPAGRHHLYVPNRYSTTRYESGLAALDRACGNAHQDLWFVLLEQELDLGCDPHMVMTMRRLPVEAPEPDAPAP